MHSGIWVARAFIRLAITAGLAILEILPRLEIRVKIDGPGFRPSFSKDHVRVHNDQHDQYQDFHTASSWLWPGPGLTANQDKLSQHGR